jgi:phage tail sheath gpL-like
MTQINIPGVYSQIDASAAVQVVSANDAVIGIVATASTGTDNKAVAPVNYQDAKTIYGADSNIVSLMKFAMDNGGNKFILVKAASTAEVASLKITAAATTAGDITVSLDGVAKIVAVEAAATAVQIADLIRATAFVGWTVSGAIGTDTVTFTATAPGDKADAVYTPGTTGALGTMTTTIQGTALTDYQAALDVLELEEAVSIVLVDSTVDAVHTLVKTHCVNASDNRRERVSYIGYAAGVDSATVKTNVATKNSGLIYTAYPNPIDINGNEVSGIYLAAAMAGLDASETDPSMPLTGLEVQGFYGLSKKLKDDEMNDLIVNGVIPLQITNGVIRVIRWISTYTKDDSAALDITWQERTTIKISHYVMKDLRADLTKKFSRAKQNKKARDSVKSAVLSKLKIYEGFEYIENVQNTDVEININPMSPTRNDVDFKYDVVTPMNVISLTGHMII